MNRKEKENYEESRTRGKTRWIHEGMFEGFWRGKSG